MLIEYDNKLTNREITKFKKDLYDIKKMINFHMILEPNIIKVSLMILKKYLILSSQIEKLKKQISMQ